MLLYSALVGRINKRHVLIFYCMKTRVLRHPTFHLRWGVCYERPTAHHTFAFVLYYSFYTLCCSLLLLVNILIAHFDFIHLSSFAITHVELKGSCGEDVCSV